MADPNPASGMPIQFQKYWLTGAGAARIAWNTEGDFLRCVREINAEIEKHGHAPLPDREIKGLCNILHRKATGGAPGHGSAEKAMGAGKKGKG